MCIINFFLHFIEFVVINAQFSKTPDDTTTLVGIDAILNCQVSTLGSLDWNVAKSDGSFDLLCKVTSSGLSGSDCNSEEYYVDPSTYSLTIKNPQVNDGLNYICYIGTTDSTPAATASVVVIGD